MEENRRPIYLDHLASTPLDPAVRAAMEPWLTAAAAGNPHSAHGAGWRAAAAVEEARAGIARLIGAERSEITLTSGATEANNLALLGLGTEVTRVIVSAIEHPSVLEPAEALRHRGVAVTVLPVDGDGRIDVAALARALAQSGPGERTLVSIMAANNEIGTLQPLVAIGEACRAHNAIFHTDAVQALSTQAIDVDAAAIDLLSLSGHKLYGPAGIGALYVRHGTPCRPLFFGGGQQGGLRPGTVPAALCAGLGEACQQALARRADDGKRLADLRERLFAGLRAVCPGLRRNSPATAVLPGCLNVTVPGLDAADFLVDVPSLAISTGAACAALSGRPSHVLRAIGLTAEQAHGSLRFGLGRETTAQDVDAAVARISATLRARVPQP